MTDAVNTSEWAHVVRPSVHGKIKLRPEDFKVEELLGYAPEGSGEHVNLLVEKRGVNTQDLMHELARKLLVHPKHISFSGLKDKQAVTRQWMSINTRKEIDTAALESQDVRILEASRHPGKLKRGSHRANAFEIVVRDLSGSDGLKAALQRVAEQGVPNYFGEQRFGRGGGNIEGAYRLFAGATGINRHLRGLYLSAARAFLFNEVVSERVSLHNWNLGLQGEVMVLDGSNSYFKTENMDEELRDRLERFDIHPSAPLWGKGELASSGEAEILESKIIARHPELARGLEAFGLRQQRRSLRLVPEDLCYEFVDAQTLKLKFTLARGAFATTVLRELITI